MGHQYSDDSDVDSDQGSHKTASDKTSSKGLSIVYLPTRDRLREARLA